MKKILFPFSLSVMLLSILPDSSQIAFAEEENSVQNGSQTIPTGIIVGISFVILAILIFVIWRVLLRKKENKTAKNTNVLPEDMLVTKSETRTEEIRQEQTTQAFEGENTDNLTKKEITDKKKGKAQNDNPRIIILNDDK